MLRSSHNNTPEPSEEASPAAGLEDNDGDSNVLLEYSTHEQPADFLDIVNLTVEYRIPTVHNIGSGTAHNPGDAARSVALGDGASCLVSTHKLVETVGGGRNAVGSGTVVALKQYHDSSTSNSIIDNPASYNALAQEIRVLCHDQQRNHENIVRLLFLGYSFTTAVPVLGVELAEHGSLDYVLRCPGYGPSILDRANLTLDIALGLDSLHACGIAHGDLKLDNVLVFSHPQRRIIAKLADFGGSCFLVEGKASRPRHHTPLWQSPEALLKDSNIDYLKSDVYSFGLVVASLWMRTATYQPRPLDPELTSCILERLVQKHFFTEEGWHLALKLWKFRRDSEVNSVVNEVSKILEWTLESEAVGLPVVIPIVQSALRTLPNERLSTKQVLRQMAENNAHPEIHDRLQRAMSGSNTSSAESSIQSKSGNDITKFKVWSEEYFRTPYQWKAIVLQHMLSTLRPLTNLENSRFEIGTPLNGLEGDDLLDTLRGLAAAFFRDSMRRTGLNHDDIQTSSRFALHAAMSFILGLGTPVNGTEGGRWLCLSALCGNVIAIQTLCEVFDVFSDFLPNAETRVPMGFFLALASLAGSNAALSKLKARLPGAAAQIELLRKTRPVALTVETTSGPYMVKLVWEYLNCASDSALPDNIEHAVRQGDLDRMVQYIDSASSVDADALHCLTFICDPIVQDLCKHLVDKGARLNAHPSMLTIKLEHRAGLAFGARDCSTALIAQLNVAPLVRAIEQKNEILALALINLHENDRVPISNYDQALGLAARWHLASVMHRLLEMQKAFPDLCRFRSGEMFPDQPKISLMFESCIAAALSPWDRLPLTRLAIHGTHANEKESRVLQAILRGKGNLGIEDWRTYFKACISLDRVSPLIIGMQLLVEEGHDPSTFLPPNPLRICMLERAPKCMREIASRYPRATLHRHRQGRTLLHMAAVSNDLDAIQLLFDVGGNEFEQLARSVYDTVIRFALQSGHTDAAFMIHAILLSLSKPAEGTSLHQASASCSTSPETFVRLLLHYTEYRTENIIRSIEWLLEHSSSCEALRKRRFQPISIDDFRPGTVEEGIEPANLIVDSLHDGIEQVTIWHEMISVPVTGFASRLQMDQILLRIIFDSFRDYVSFKDCKGWNALHTAVWNGHVTAVALLLDHETIDVNCETGFQDLDNNPHPLLAEGFYEGYTALNLATEALMRLPPASVRKGGFRELSEWDERLRLIIKMLVDKGAASGSGASKRAHVAALRFTQPNVQVMFMGLTGVEDQRRQIVYSGAWPRPVIAADRHGSEQSQSQSQSCEKDDSTWWSNKIPILHDYFKPEYGVWPDLPWLRSFDAVGRHTEMVAKQIPSLNLIIAIKERLSRDVDVRLAADGDLCFYDRKVGDWLRDEDESVTTIAETDASSISHAMDNLSVQD